jgi:hypothetical protein
MPAKDSEVFFKSSYKYLSVSVFNVSFSIEKAIFEIPFIYVLLIDKFSFALVSVFYKISYVLSSGIFELLFTYCMSFIIFPGS